MAIDIRFGDSTSPGVQKKGRILKIIVVFVFLVFVGRLAQLQVVEGHKYRSDSEAQAIKTVRIEPFRGNVFDRNGNMLVHNEPSFSVILTPNDFHRNAIPLLCSILGIDSLEIIKLLDANKGFSKFVPIKIHRDADFRIVSLIEEYSDHLSGVEIMIDSKRLYEFEGNMAHVLGYTREISKEQLARTPFLYQGDQIGQSGIELTYDDDLRGREGLQFVTVNKFGQKVSSFDNGRSDISSKNGFDVYLGIDIRLQEHAEKLLKDRRGAIVALDPGNGSVLAMVSKPDYDPRDFSGKISASLYNSLMNDPASPMLNRAIQSQYPPGSTWKMLIAIAALQEGIIDENTTIHCSGGLNYGGRFWKCHGTHGNINARRAIQTSCNTYFYTLGMKLGIDLFEKYTNLFNFGYKTGIDLPHERSGLIPTRDWLTKRFGKIPFTGRMINYGIGQGEILITPLQMAAYTASIANGGYYYRPRVVTHIRNNLTNKLEPLENYATKIPIDERILNVIKNGMSDVVNVSGGTAASVRISDVEVCGKTGTAQNPQGKDHAWFVCFAPKNDPQIAMCVFVENAGFGGAIAAPIAAKLLKAFFNPELYENPEQLNLMAITNRPEVTDDMLEEIILEEIYEVIEE